MPTVANDPTAAGGKKQMKQARLFSKITLPPCPTCPDTPQSPHPDWIVRKLPKPECIENPSGELVWVFYCFYHKRTYKTEWFPPPPPPAIPYKDSGEDDSGSVDDDDDDDDNNEDGVIDLVDEEEDEHPSKRRKGIEAVLR